MGTSAHVIVTGNPRLEREAIERLRDLDRKWTRFSPSSELSRINSRAGVPVVVSSDTFGVVERAVAGWHLSGGRFDPTGLKAIRGAGYDQSFDELERVSDAPVEVACPLPGCGAIALFPSVPAVCLPPTVALDLGGVGKGWAADLVTDELMAAGAAGACVNVGGDLRVQGEAPTDAGWVLAVEHARRPGDSGDQIRLSNGAVATTSRLHRRWRRGERELHHILDPRTGAPAVTSVAAVTVIAGEAWLAEVLAKALFLAPLGRDEALLARHQAATFVTLADGTRSASRDFEAFAA